MRYWELRVLGFVLLLIAQGVLSTWPDAAVAARYHVRVGGLRPSGPSVPGDWSLANCYTDLPAALAAASAPDSVLLYREIHNLGSPVVLTALLANQDLDVESHGCIVRLQGDGSMQANGTPGEVIVAGISIHAFGSGSTSPALRISNSNGLGEQVVVRYCNFLGHTGSAGAPNGGSAVAAVGHGHDLELMFTDCVFSSNKAAGHGGAVFIGDGYSARFDSCRFDDNRTASQTEFHGGALAVVSPNTVSHLDLIHCEFARNRAGSRGGAVYVLSADCEFRDSDFTENHSNYEGVSEQYQGPGVYIFRWNDAHGTLAVSISGCRFTRNAPEYIFGWNFGGGDGGGLFVAGRDSDGLYDVVVSDTIFEDNFNVQGAGFYLGRYAVGLVERCYFVDNTAYGRGGGFYKGGFFETCQGETARLEYCLFWGNRAGYSESGFPSPYLYGARGGAVMVRRFPRVEALNCTFAENIVGGEDARGDAFFHADEGLPFDGDEQRCRLVNNLFWAEEGVDAQVRSDAGGFSEVSDCAWGDGEFVCEGAEPEGIVVLGGQPFVGDGDFQLAPGALCIDSGQDLGLSLDFAGNPVPYGPEPDIGAYEWQGPATSAPDAVPAQVTYELSAWPNPSNPVTTLAFELPSRSHVELRIFDARGHLVRELQNATLSAGRHSISWTGTDTKGRPVASGVYFAQLGVAGESVVRLITVVR